MSTPRQDRKGYLSVIPGALTEQEVTQTLLSRAGVDDDELAELLRDSISELKELIHAKTYLATSNGRGQTNLMEINDNSARLKAIDTLLKLTSSYPKQSGKAAGTPIHLHLPEYYDTKPTEG